MLKSLPEGLAISKWQILSNIIMNQYMQSLQEENEGERERDRERKKGLIIIKLFHGYSNVFIFVFSIENSNRGFLADGLFTHPLSPFPPLPFYLFITNPLSKKKKNPILNPSIPSPLSSPSLSPSLSLSPNDSPTFLHILEEETQLYHKLPSIPPIFPTFQEQHLS